MLWKLSNVLQNNSKFLVLDFFESRQIFAKSCETKIHL